MKKFIMGLFTGLAITTTAVFGSNLIKSAEYNTSKIVFDGVELDTAGQPMVSIQEEGVSGTKNYMPVRSVLEQMGYNVTWDGTNNTVIIKSTSNINNTDSVNTEDKTNNVIADVSKDNIYNINEKIVFTDNTEIKILNTYTTDSAGTFSADDGETFYAMEMEVTAKSNPESGQYWTPPYFIDSVKTDEGVVYNQPMSFGESKIYPNEKVTFTVYMSIPDDATVSEIIASNGIGEKRTVKVN